MKDKKTKNFAVIAALLLVVVIIGIIVIFLQKKNDDEVASRTENVTEASSDTAAEESAGSGAATGVSEENSGETTEATTSEKTTEVTTEVSTEEETTDIATPPQAEPDSSGYVVLKDDNTSVLTTVGSKEHETKVSYERLRFTLPANWVGSNQPDQNKCYFFYSDHGVMMLNKQFLGTGVDLNAEGSLEDCIVGVEEGGFSNVEHVQSFQVGEKTGYVLKGDAPDGQGGTGKGTVIYCQIGKNIYTFIFLEENGYSYEDDINSFISSIEKGDPIGE